MKAYGWRTKRRRRSPPFIDLFQALVLFCVYMTQTIMGARYDIKPRVRKEWRKLTKQERRDFADAVWIMKATSTEEGRRRYGKKFHNHDELTVLHACSVVDPRCDQAHQGPHYGTFHRAYVLAWENSVLAVLHVERPESTVEAMPYWDTTLDSSTGIYRHDPDKYIFTDHFFGDFIGDPNNEHVVTNGLFAYFPVGDWTSESFGAKSSLNHRCTQEEWYRGTQATICDECCGQGDDCECGPGSKFRRFLRGNDDWARRQDRCANYVTRNTWESPAINGLHDIQGSQEDYDTCVDPANIKTWMDWQYCLDFSQASCLLLVAVGMYLDPEYDCRETLPKVMDGLHLPISILGFFRKMIMRNKVPILCSACTFEGTVKTTRNGRKKNPVVQHTLAHLMTGGDFGDLLTSPNDPGPFYGYHANTDRSNMEWMINTEDELEKEMWGYPSSKNSDVGDMFTMAGPYPVYPMMGCAVQPDVFTEYNLLNKWIPGTLLEDVINSGFPFDTLFDEPPANGWGYTHEEVIHYTSPKRTPYTYDTLAKYYYDDYDDEVASVGGDPVRVDLFAAPP